MKGLLKKLPGLLLRLLPWGFILLPAVLAAQLLDRHVVNVPFLDDWMFTEMYEKARGMHGGLTWHDFFTVQMEHRLAWPRAVIMVLDKICPGNFAAQCWVTYGLLCVTQLNIGLLLRRTGRPFSSWWPLLALAGMAVFSPVQYQIMLWPMMFQVATPAAALTSALVFLGARPLKVGIRFLLCAACATLASLSIASGLLLWVLLMPVILWSNFLERKEIRLPFLGAWCAAFAVMAGMYFHNLKNETDGQFSYRAGQDEVTTTKGLGALLRDPAQGIAFAARFVAGPVSRGSSGPMMDVAIVAGALLLGGIAAFGLLWLWRFKNAELRAEWIPWLALGLYAPGTGFMVALGRAWATRDGDNALQARYVIHGVPLLVALLVLAWLAGSRWARRRPENGMAFNCGAAMAGGAAFVVLLVGWLHGAFMMKVWESSRLRGLVNTLFFEIGAKNETWVDPDSQLVSMHDFALRTNRLGLLTPPMFKSNRIDQFRQSGAFLKSSTAELENLRLMTDDTEPRHRAIAEGFASLPLRQRVADGIFFACRESRGKDPWKIFCVAQVEAMPLNLAESLGRDMRFVFGANKEMTHNLASFHVEFPLEKLPQGYPELEVGAWAYDVKKNTVYPMPGRYRVNLKQPKIIKLRNPDSPSRNPDNAADDSGAAENP